ncbi:MAG: hypothetical protein DWQ05_12015 [Calditrichaeota bacterium]|nr:MAG: hypothetical protein DWQ05_12015 [Calditrichota bacterium]
MTETELLDILKKDPTDLNNYDELAAHYEENGDDEKAVKVLKDALEKVETNDLGLDEETKNMYITSYYLDIASLLGGLSKFSESDKYLDLATDRELENNDLHQFFCYRANNFYHSYILEEKPFDEKAFLQACEWAQKSADLSPDDIGRVYMFELLCKMYAELNDSKKAEEYARKTIELAAKIDDPEAIDGYFAYAPYSYVAECYFNAEDTTNTIRMLLESERAGVEQNADEGFMFSTFTSLGQCYAFEGAHNLALAYFEKAHAIKEDEEQLNEWITKLKEILETGGNSKN